MGCGDPDIQGSLAMLADAAALLLMCAPGDDEVAVLELHHTQLQIGLECHNAQAMARAKSGFDRLDLPFGKVVAGLLQTELEHRQQPRKDVLGEGFQGGALPGAESPPDGPSRRVALGALRRQMGAWARYRHGMLELVESGQIGKARGEELECGQRVIVIKARNRPHDGCAATVQKVFSTTGRRRKTETEYQVLLDGHPAPVVLPAHNLTPAKLAAESDGDLTLAWQEVPSYGPTHVLHRHPACL